MLVRSLIKVAQGPTFCFILCHMIGWIWWAVHGMRAFFGFGALLLLFQRCFVDTGFFIVLCHAFKRTSSQIVPEFHGSQRLEN